MKIKQISLRAFEIDPSGESDEAIVEYIVHQEAILKRFLLLFVAPIGPELVAQLKKAGFSLAIRRGELIQKSAARLAQADQPVSQRATATQVRHKPVRSGERIECEGDLIAFGRVNSGAELFVEGNGTLFGQLDGLLSCGGEVAVLHGVGRSAVVIFGGEVIESDRLNQAPLKLHKIAGKIAIEPLEMNIK